MLHDTTVGIRGGDVLADRVQRAAETPRIEDVPHVGALIRRVHRRSDPLEVLGSPAVAEARNESVGSEIFATRHTGTSGITAEVHVHVSAPLLVPDEADQIAAITADG